MLRLGLHNELVESRMGREGNCLEPAATSADDFQGTGANASCGTEDSDAFSGLVHGDR